MKFNNKRRTKNLMLTSLIAIASPLSIIPLMSCSLNDIESQLKKLLYDESLFNIEINAENIKKVTNKDTITIEDIFTVNTETIKIIDNTKLLDWNSSVENIYEIKPEIIGVVFPEMNESKKIDEIKIIYDLSTGPYENFTQEKILKLNDIDNSLLDGKNYFELSQNKEELNANFLWRRFKENLIEFLKTKDIQSEDEDIETKTKFKFPEKNEGNYTAYQTNLYSAFDSKDARGVWLNIYTSNEELSLEKIKTDAIAIKIYFTFQELGGN